MNERTEESSICFFLLFECACVGASGSLADESMRMGVVRGETARIAFHLPEMLLLSVAINAVIMSGSKAGRQASSSWVVDTCVHVLRQDDDEQVRVVSPDPTDLFFR
eukprot:GHVU01070566.1.p3 GENE.GHVU01070566.1~~GHVU01070566.1.p3  ORF type:complete len:107 (-),score=13.95 GHVU01070566.1:61-381(-)